MENPDNRSYSKKYAYDLLKKKNEIQDYENWGHSDLIAYIHVLKEEIASLKNEKEELIKLRNEYASQKLQEHESIKILRDQFKQNWSYPSKVAFLLSFKNAPLTSLQLHDLLNEIDEGYKFHHNPKANLLVHLSIAQKSGRIKSIKLPGIKCHFLVLPEWMDESGRLLDRYKAAIRPF